jgi:SWI/SNF-related matrix-associated actin-dependent regulator of chromatin subfamily B member 1
MSLHAGGPAVGTPSSPALGGVGQLGIQRPPSRPRTSSGFHLYGQGQPPKPPTPIQSSLPQQQQQQPQANTPTHASSPFPQQQLQLQQQQPSLQQQQQQSPQVQMPQGFNQVPSTPITGSPGRKRRLTGQGGLDAQPSPQFGGIGGGLTGLSMNNAGNVGAGGLMSMPQSMGSPNPALIGGAGGGLMGPPHVVPSRSSSLGGQIPQLPQGLDDSGLFQPQLAGSQTSLPPQVPQTPMAGPAVPFQTPSGVPSVGIGGGGMRQRPTVLGAPGFPDVQPPLQSPVVPKMPQTVVTPAQMQMQMHHSSDSLTVNTGLPEVPGLPVVPDATVVVPHPHPPAAPTSAAPSATTLPTLPTTTPTSAPVSGKTMRVTLVPPTDIKPLTEDEVVEVKGWMARDKEYEAVYRSMKERMGEELRSYRAENSDLWWEVTDGKKLRTKFGVTYPGHRLRDNRKRGRREGFRL